MKWKRYRVDGALSNLKKNLDRALFSCNVNNFRKLNNSGRSSNVALSTLAFKDVPGEPEDGSHF